MKKDKNKRHYSDHGIYEALSILIFASLVLAVIGVALTLYVPILTGQGVDCIISKGNVDFARLISIIKTTHLYRIDGGSAVADESCQ